jgi:hypothetical protein
MGQTYSQQCGYVCHPRTEWGVDSGQVKVYEDRAADALLNYYRWIAERDKRQRNVDQTISTIGALQNLLDIQKHDLGILQGIQNDIVTTQNEMNRVYIEGVSAAISNRELVFSDTPKYAFLSDDNNYYIEL